MKRSPHFLILSLLTMMPVAAPHVVEAKDDGILGTWRPVELGSDALKQIQFLDHQGNVEMRMWPSINGGEMADHPSSLLTDISTTEARNTSPGKEPFTVYRQLSFVDTTYDISLTNKSLRVTVTKEYTDDSGRGVRQSDLFFVRGTYERATQAATEPELIESGWLGIWKNRDQSTRGIAQLTIRDLDPVTMNVYGIMSGGISKAPVSTVTLPISGVDAAKSGASGRLTATADLGWANITYKMRLHSDGITLEQAADYTDPDRPDREHEYELVRGFWK
ncbi:MAG: hypothetical protein AAF357_07260 [Verrucomicrobiota bacterium]